MKVLVVVLALVFATESSAQTLADIARRERARQKQAESSKKGTYTNATVIGTPATSPAPAAPAPTPAQKPPEKKEEGTAKPVGPTDNKGRDEKYWREAFQKARDAVKQAEEKVQLQEVRLRDLNTQFLRQNDIYNKENVLGAEITAAQKDLDAAKAEAEQARNKVSSLEEELRASGGLPGWAR